MYVRREEIYMRNLNLILALALITGCGSSKKAETISPAPTGSKSDQQISLSQIAKSDSELGNCDASKLGQVCYSGSNDAYYYCTVSGNWSETQIFPTTTTMTVSASNGNCIGSPAKISSNVTANSANSANTWVSPTTGLTWQFGNMISPSDLKSSNPNVFTQNFLCPLGTIAPTQAQLETEFSSSFLDWFGSQFLIVGVVNETYKGSYYIVVADAQSKFDLINAIQISVSTPALCIQQK